MTKEEFSNELRELLCRAMDSGHESSWIMGEAAFQVFAMFMARAEVNARSKEQHEKGYN